MKYGGWAVEKELIEWIYNNYDGDAILELGSGEGSTEILRTSYEMHSIENNKEWLNKYTHVNYIYAPIKKHKAVKNHDGDLWYDPEVLRQELPKIDYGLLLIDGPDTSRTGFLKYFDLFRHDVPIVLDDLQRFNSYKLAKSISNKLGKPFTVYGCYNGGKAFATFIP